MNFDVVDSTYRALIQPKVPVDNQKNGNEDFA
jgi:hypothetical protein